MALIDEPGTIILTTGDITRYRDFFISLRGLNARGIMIWKKGLDVARQFNDALRLRKGSWVWFLGDDHEFDRNILMHLLGRDVDMVAPLIYKRQLPPQTVVYNVDWTTVRFCVSCGKPHNGIYRRGLELRELHESGLGKVDAVGSSGLLVKEEVLRILSDPWFEVGRLDADASGEDIWFAIKAGLAGFECWLDVDVAMSHITPCSLWPVKKNGKWTVNVKVGNEGVTVEPRSVFIEAMRDGWSVDKNSGLFVR